MSTMLIQKKREELETVLRTGKSKEYLENTEKRVTDLVSFDKTRKVPSLHIELECIRNALSCHAEEAFVREELESLNAIVAGKQSHRFT